MKKLKILNLYAGIGGNRKLWGNDHDITAVELNPDIAAIYQDFFPNDTVIVGDAHEYLLNHFRGFDFIWSSPPCQSHSQMMKATRHDIVKYPDMSLYQEIIWLQHFCKAKWVVENVKPYYTPLIPYTFSLERHLFWSNFIASDYQMKTNAFCIGNATVEKAEEMKTWLGLNFEGNIYYENNHCPVQVLRNCVHPELGKHIFDCAFKGAAQTLFDIPQMEQSELFI